MQPEISCKNCGNFFIGKYCNRCGEKVYADHDKTVVHFMEEGLHFITHFEGTFFTTLRTMFTDPGKLSLDVSEGIRKKYFKPLSLFLLLVVIYLLFPFIEGLNMQMQYYPRLNFYGGYASEVIQQKMALTGLNEIELGKVFHEKSEKYNKFFLILLIPLTALFYKLIFFRKKKYFFDYLVFSAEINSMYLLWSYLILAFIVWAFGLQIPESKFVWIMTLPFLLYVVLCTHRYFKIGWWKSVLITIVFGAVYIIIIIQFLYKFILFITTMSQIH